MKSKLTNAVVLALAILGGLFIVLVAFFAITGEQDKPTYTRDDVEVKVQQDYKSPSITDTMATNWERVFVDSCSTEANRSACQCMFDYLDSHLTNTQFENLDIDNDPVAGLAIIECYDK